MVVDLHGKFMGVRRSKVWAGKHFIAVSSRQIESSARALSISLSGKEGKARAGSSFKKQDRKNRERCRKAAPLSSSFIDRCEGSGTLERSGIVLVPFLHA